VPQIVECIPFFNELDILDIRLNEEFEAVDRFIVCEARQTFQGTGKPLYFEQNKDRYSQFLHKIEHLVIEQMPDTPNPWIREDFQRNYFRYALRDLHPRDIVIMADVDEILSRRALAELRTAEGFIQFEMPMYQYYLNLRARAAGWTKAYAFSMDMLDHIPNFSTPRTREAATLEKFAPRSRQIANAGWHFTFLGGVEKVLTKLSSFSHNDGWYQETNSRENVERLLTIGYVVESETELARYVPIDDSFPPFVVENRQRFLNNGLIKDIYAAMSELQTLFSSFEQSMRASRRELALMKDTLDHIGHQIGKYNMFTEA
jgi:hypothetical protein